MVTRHDSRLLDPIEFIATTVGYHQLGGGGGEGVGGGGGGVGVETDLEARYV